MLVNGLNGVNAGSITSSYDPRFKPVTLETAQAAASSAGKTLSELTLALAKPQSSQTTAVSEPSHGDEHLKFESIRDAVIHIQTIAETHEKEELKSITNEQGLVKEVQKQMQDPARSTYKQLAEIEENIRSNEPVDPKTVRKLYNELKCRLYEIQLRDQSVTGLKDATDEPFTDAKVGKTGRAREVFDHNQHAAAQLLGEARMAGKSQHELYFEGNMKWLESKFEYLKLSEQAPIPIANSQGKFVVKDAPFLETAGPKLSELNQPSRMRVVSKSRDNNSTLVFPPQNGQSYGTDDEELQWYWWCK